MKKWTDTVAANVSTALAAIKSYRGSMRRLRPDTIDRDTSRDVTRMREAEATLANTRQRTVHSLICDENGE